MGIPHWMPKLKRPRKKPSAAEVARRLRKRYGLEAVWASDIADQLYCEKRVELRLLHPEVQKETAEQRAGSEAHEQLTARAVPVSEKQLREQLASGKRILLREFPFRGRIRGIPIIGKPDLVAFDGLKALLLADYKFSRRREPYPDHRLQLALYGLLLHQNKFDTSQLATVLVFLSPEQRQAGVEHLEKQLLSTYNQLRNAVLGKHDSATHAEERAACFAYRFDLAGAKNLIEGPIGFWLGSRAAIPTRHENKCKVCEFNAVGLCESALARANPVFVKSIRTARTP